MDIINKRSTKFVFNFIGVHFLRTVSTKGFTLVELIIVIAILGILAVGLLVAIDPVEQFAKARDSNRRRAAVEYLGAFNRYIAIQARYPWGNGATSINAATSGLMATLAAAGELSNKYTAKLTSTMGTAFPLTARAETFGSGVRVCFSPESKGVKSDPQTKYYNSLNTTGCSYATGGTCFFCSE